MFCRNCGNELNANAIACLSCGCDPNRGNKNCQNCGVETNPEQIICIKCGAGLNKSNLSLEGGKTVAIVAYLTLIGFIIALIQHGTNKTKLGAYHLRQVVGFMVTGFAALIIIEFLGPLFNTTSVFVIAGNVFFPNLYILEIALICFIITIIISLLNAINGKEKPAPIFGKLFEKWFANLFN
jgi:hypothetical protein